MNRLYYGDCLTIMQQLKMGSVDLVYLDPPFNTNRDYSAIYEDETGRPLPDQIEAFNDLWQLDEGRLRAIRHMPILMRDAGIRVEERPFTVDEAKSAREAVLTSTTSFVYPVVQIDDAVVGNGKPGSTTLDLRGLYVDYTRNAVPSPAAARAAE